MKIPFAKIDCSGNEQRYVREVIESGWLTTAGRALEFEQRFAEAVGTRHACAVNSCTAALHLGLEALGIGPGDKVIVPTLTFTATAEVVRYLGADPVFVDVDYATRLVTSEIVADALHQHPEAKAVMVVHFGGQPAQMTAVGKKIDPSNSEFRIPNPELECSANDPTVHGLPSSSDPQPSTLNPQPVRVPGIMDVCRAHGVRVVEDAAHAFPARWGGRMIGSIGDITCFSFYANKTITTAEGGMLTTDDERLFKRVKVMRLHGIDRDIWNRFTAEKPSWEYDVVAPGFKYNLPDVNAAIGLAQLERAEAMRRVRQHCVEYYLDHLAGIDCLDLPVNRVPWTDHACHLFPLVVKPEAPVNRNRLIELLFERGIGTSVHYKPLHRMTYYRERYQLNPELFPNAERIWQGAVTLPLYPSLTEEDQAYVVEAVRELLDGGSQ